MSKVKCVADDTMFYSIVNDPLITGNYHDLNLINS